MTRAQALISKYRKQISRLRKRLASAQKIRIRVVYHRGDSDHERPDWNGPIQWRGWVEPKNSIDGDEWLNLSSKEISQMIMAENLINAPRL